jgi:gas vesicle protein
MGEDPNAIRQEIEATRERMGETVDALSYKADVPTRTRESIQEKVQGVKSKLTGVGSQVSEATPDAGDVKHAGRQAVGDVKHAGRQAVGVAQENPLGLAIGAAAAGFLAGMLIPSTRVEDERLGPVADQVKEQAQHTAQEALEHGKQVAQETAQSATESVRQAAGQVKDTAQQTAQTHAEELKQSAQDSAQEVAQSAPSP